MEKNHHEEVKEYYGQTLKQSEDLKTNACCTAEVYPPYIRNILKDIHEEVLSKYYGCGLCIPTALKDCRVLDLGSGAGRDCYLLSQLVGAEGYVVGVDMTPEQLEVARRHIDFHTDQFQFKKTNVEFREGQIEDLEDLGLKDDFFDVVISNCVINLVPNKAKVLEQVHRVLKSGGEFYFSDVYCNRRIPEALVKDPVLYGECLSGALYWGDFVQMAREAGFSDPRIVNAETITIENAEVQEKLKGYEFQSITYRLFKDDTLEGASEDYRQSVGYRGGMMEAEETFTLDAENIFPVGKMESVSGNTYRMLKNSRLAQYFEFHGDFSTHYGAHTRWSAPVPQGKKTAEKKEIEKPQKKSCC